MRTLLFVLAAVAVAAIADESRPFPMNAVCSIKAEGSARLNAMGNKFEGTAVMKRVRDSLRIDVTSQMVNFSVIARGDKNETKVHVTGSAMQAVIPTGCALAGAVFALNNYTYYGPHTTPGGINTDAFTHPSGSAAMYFYQNESKLLGEELAVQVNGMDAALSVMYDADKVLPYERTDAADGAFNSDECEFTGDDEYSLTAKCPEGPHSTSSTTPEPSSSSETDAAGVIVPSLALLLTAAVLLL